MPVELSEHAKSGLRKRGIPRRIVLDTVRKPDDMIVSFRGRKLRRKKIGDKILEVVTKTEGSNITVITAYYLEGRDDED